MVLSLSFASTTNSRPFSLSLFSPPTRSRAVFGPAPCPLNPLVDPWAQLADRHAGQNCLLIGNGPSLNKVDWSFLNDAAFPVVLGTNKIYLARRRRAAFSRQTKLPLTHAHAGLRAVQPAYKLPRMHEPAHLDGGAEPDAL